MPVSAELFLENPVFFLQIAKDLLLIPVQPAREGQNQEVEWGDRVWHGAEMLSATTGKSTFRARSVNWTPRRGRPVQDHGAVSDMAL